MLSIPGYFDGDRIQFLELVDILKNQRVPITVMDEFIESSEPLIE